MKPVSAVFLMIVLFLPVHAGADPLKEALELDRQGFVAETLPHWEEFISSQPEKKLDIFAHIKLSIALTRSGHFHDAFKVAETLYKRYPDDFHARFNFGNRASAIKRFPEAIASFEKVVSLHPDEGLGYLGLGLSLFGDQKTEPALKVMRKARKLFKKQKIIGWYQNVRIMIGQLKSFAPYPPDFSNLWLTNNLKTIDDTYQRTLFLGFENSLGL